MSIHVSNYNEIPTKENLRSVNIPGVYCKCCGETFALYSWSVHQPDGYDKNGKPYYNFCFICHGTMS